jgi:lipopolysaccharide/colanic/teichoic acid biosynthesis glycosyltransferase
LLALNLVLVLRMEASPLPSQPKLYWVDPDQAPEPQLTAGAALRKARKSAPAGRVVIFPLRHQWYRTGKTVVDFVLALLLTVPALPIVALSALVVKLTSPGPAFYTQIRVGRAGRPFTIFKIRTMIENCESLTGPRWSIPGDPRVTRVGWFLRATHLDELPQLLNVLRGEMSLIGPRPERPEFLPELEQNLPAYRERLSVRPGVTGLAQVQLPADSDIPSVERKLAHDLYYIRYLSPWLDFRLLICTAFYALGMPFALLSGLLGIPQRGTVQEAMQDVFGVPAPVARRRSA